MQKTLEILVGKLDCVKEIRPAESVDVSQITVHSLIKYQNVMSAYRMRWHRPPAVILAEVRESDLVCRLTYNDDVVRQTPDQLAVFQGANDEHI
jgi:hypothetical protein